MNGHKIVENIFFTVTCVSVFTCVIRSDYNFAMGLLCYYMIKNLGNKQGTEISKIARTVSVASRQFEELNERRIPWKQGFSHNCANHQFLTPTFILFRWSVYVSWPSWWTFFGSSSCETSGLASPLRMPMLGRPLTTFAPSLYSCPSSMWCSRLSQSCSWSQSCVAEKSWTHWLGRATERVIFTRRRGKKTQMSLKERGW